MCVAWANSNFKEVGEGYNCLCEMKFNTVRFMLPQISNGEAQCPYGSEHVYLIGSFQH